MKKQSKKAVVQQKRVAKKQQRRREKVARYKLPVPTTHLVPKTTPAVKDAIEQVAHLAFSSLEQGVAFYFAQEGVSDTIESLWTDGVDKHSFSCGIRGYLSEDGSLKVTAPLTWDTGKESPVVKDYLADLWNPDLTHATQINAIAFLVEDESEDKKEVLAGCVISAGIDSRKVDGFLVFQEGRFDEETRTLKIDGGHAFTHSVDVLHFPLPTMRHLTKKMGGNDSVPEPAASTEAAESVESNV